MKSFFRIFLTAAALISFASCGSNTPAGNPVAVFDGPELDITEALQLEINHFYVKDWTGTSKTPSFSVYIQDSIHEDYLVCAGPDEGLNIAVESGVYYGKLSIPLREVIDATDHNSLEFIITIVADQENPCPSKPESNNVIASKIVSYDEMIDQPIEFGDEEAVIAFKGVGHDDIEIENLASPEDDLSISEIYFETPAPSSDIPNYYIKIDFVNNQLITPLTIYPAEMPEMRSERILYSWLNLSFSEIDPSLSKMEVKVGLYRIDASSTVEIGSTEGKPLVDLYGGKFEFTNNSGYIKFRSLLQ